MAKDESIFNADQQKALEKEDRLGGGFASFSPDHRQLFHRTGGFLQRFAMQWKRETTPFQQFLNAQVPVDPDDESKGTEPRLDRLSRQMRAAGRPLRDRGSLFQRGMRLILKRPEDRTMDDVYDFMGIPLDERRRGPSKKVRAAAKQMLEDLGGDKTLEEQAKKVRDQVKDMSPADARKWINDLQSGMMGDSGEKGEAGMAGTVRIATDQTQSRWTWCQSQ